MKNRRTFPSFPLAAGFTLVEMIIVIVLTGIVAGMVAVFIRSPIQAYSDTVRRARLSDAADAALRSLGRDLRSALPNSVRVTVIGGVSYLEYIPTVGGGRYRQYPTAAGAGDILDFSTADGAFDVVGPVPVYAAGNSVVVFNLEPGSAADAYASTNRAVVTSGNANVALLSTDAAPHNIVLAAATRFPAPSPSARFQMVAPPVTYACTPVAGGVGGTLTRTTGYGFIAPQPAPPVLGAASLLVAQVGACTITYNPNALNMRTGLVTIALTLTDSGENVSLVHQIHVQNQP